MKCTSDTAKRRLTDTDWTEVNEIANGINILDVVERYQDPASHQGFKILFHCVNNSDTTPSLVVDEKVNLYKCFSCGSGGNALSYLIKERKLPVQEAVSIICNIAGVDEQRIGTTSDTVKFFKQQKSQAIQEDKSASRIYKDYKDYQEFERSDPQEWIDEGIQPWVMELFDVRIDRKSNRIVYPVYDQNGRFITAKGRTRFTDYKLLGLAKYINYSKIGTTDFLSGMEVTGQYIREEKTIIIVEGIKSVYKLFGWGYRYCAASETSALNINQIKLLISLDLNEVIIAFDKDKDFRSIKENASMLRRFTRVSIIYDKENLLSEKESPVDHGLEVFENLLNSRINL